jgi:hypothetical protein
MFDECKPLSVGGFDDGGDGRPGPFGVEPEGSCGRLDPPGVGQDSGQGDDHVDVGQVGSHDGLGVAELSWEQLIECLVAVIEVAGG